MATQKVEWRQVMGTTYRVSNTGLVVGPRGRVLTPMRTGTKRTSSQRSKVRLSTNPIDDRDVAHLVLEAFVGPRPDGCVAMHLDDNSANNDVSNLRWGTAADNARDSVKKLRHGTQRLSPIDALAILRMRQHGALGVSVAAMYGVSAQRICDIVKGRVAVIGKQE